MINEAKRLAAQHFGCVPEDMSAVADVTNNSVFTFTSGGKPYIFKFYKSKYWPEDGKLPFVVRKLMENGIRCADIKVFTREHPEFSAGYLIEEKIAGISGDKAELDAPAEENLYGKLAEFISEVHRIRLGGFGYICDGSPAYDSMYSFFEDEFDERAEKLIESGVFTAGQIEILRERFLGVLKDFGDLPPVLCHGDLAAKNIMLQDSGEIVMIDWDDAMAYCWMADVSRFTFWLRLNFSEDRSAKFRQAFLEHYAAGERKEDFSVFEQNFHIYICLDFLAYYLKTGDEGMCRKLTEILSGYLS